MNHDDKVTYFAETDARSKRLPFGIKSSDRTRHVYAIGKTGMGKSTMLENMAIQDIKNGEGLAFLDPHGKTAELLLDYVPQERIKDVLYFAPFDLEFPISFNVMEDVGADRRHLVANGLMSAFKKLWVDAWSARMEYILNNILLSLLEYPDSTLIGVNRMLADKDYRNKVVENISDPSVKAFWTDEFAKYGERYMQEAGAAIQNKIGQFVSNPIVRNIIGQPKSTFDLRKMMDEKKIIIINLSKGRVGESNANLLGSMLITKIYLAAMSRADSSPSALKSLPNFYLYVDEFQSFANESFADILSEARKYKLNLTIAHQYIEQMSEEVRAAVFGNVGTMIVFRVGAIDAEVLEKEFFPTFTKEDLVNLGFVQVYMKLMIDGVTSSPFSATTLPPIEKPLISFKEDIIEASREAFARPRHGVEEAIRIWHEPIRRSDSATRISSPKRVIPAPKENKGRDEGLKGAINDSYLRHTEDEKKDGERQLQKKAADEAAAHTKKLEEEQYEKTRLEKVLEEKKKQELAKLDEQKKSEIPKAAPKPMPVIQPSRPKAVMPQTKKDKGPTPQNMNALRDALSAVLQHQGAPIQDAKPAAAPAKAESKQAERAVPQGQVQEATPTQSSQQPQATTGQPHTAGEKTEHAEPKHHKEVPEAILRKVLELDN